MQALSKLHRRERHARQACIAMIGCLSRCTRFSYDIVYYTVIIIIIIILKNAYYSPRCFGRCNITKSKGFVHTYTTSLRPIYCVMKIAELSVCCASEGFPMLSRRWCGRSAYGNAGVGAFEGDKSASTSVFLFFVFANNIFFFAPERSAAGATCLRQPQ